MEFQIGGTCKCGCDEKVFLWFVTKPLQIRWFTDFGEWFFYIHIGKRYWRFSSAGYLKGKSK